MAVDEGLVVCAAQGNVEGEWDNPAIAHSVGEYLIAVRPPACPAVASKVIAVGGYDDGGTTTLSDDTMWIVENVMPHPKNPGEELDAIVSRAGPTNLTHTKWTKPDVVAPAKDLTSCNAGWQTGDPYRTSSGTSAATPLVAGASALILQGHPDWAPSTVKEALKSTAVLTGDLATTRYSWEFGPENIRGKGLINATAAIAMQKLMVQTYTTQSLEVTGVNVWINGSEYPSPVQLLIKQGAYNVTVPSKFYRQTSFYNFTCWNINSTSNSVIINVYETTNMIAYYNCTDNQAPTTPSTPTGPTSGTGLTYYYYSTSAFDPEGDLIRYEFSWGDGTHTLTGWHQSGATVSVSHAWSLPGTYNITVRAQDPGGAWSNWSTNLTVSITPWPVNLVVMVPQAPLEGVKVWIDGAEYMAYENAPVNVTVIAGQHIIEVQAGFLKQGGAGEYYMFTFNCWSDGSKDNPRTITITADTTLTALYARSEIGIELLQPP
jgi:hypothetical protein